MAELVAFDRCVTGPRRLGSQARDAFGKIGSSTVGAALAETLQARHEAGQRLGDYAQRVAAHIRRNLGDYRSKEQLNVTWLKDTQAVGGGSPGCARRFMSTSVATATPSSPRTTPSTGYKLGKWVNTQRVSGPGAALIPNVNDVWKPSQAGHGIPDRRDGTRDFDTFRNT